MRKRYNFDLLLKHSNETALSTRRNHKPQMACVRSAFGFLDVHFHRLEQKPVGLVRNVKLALTARFTNHLFSMVQLCERGLVLDAFNCSRSGIETSAFYWLVCLDPQTAALYEAERSQPPVEVRKRLETLGVEVKELRELYSYESAIAHVGNKYDNLQIRWDEGASGKLMVGGGSVPLVQRAILETVPSTVARFVRHDDDYLVTIREDHFEITTDEEKAARQHV
jgi:hypothetical protein